MHDNRSCNQVYIPVGRQCSTLATLSMFMAATVCICEGRQARLLLTYGSTACTCTTGDKQGSTATADQLRRKTPSQLQTSVDAMKANHRNRGERSATAHFVSHPASLRSFFPASLGTSAYIGGECCEREVGAVMLCSLAQPCRCVQSFSLTDKPVL